MTGLELLEGLSYVDPRYIEEAETASLNRNTPFMKWVSVAACLCILAVGAFAYNQVGRGGAMEGIVEQAATEAAPAAMEDMYTADEPAAGAPKEEAAAEEGTPETAQVPAGELQQIPAATLRIIRVEDDHWMAVVEAVSDEPTVFEVGMQVTVIVDAGQMPENGEEDEDRYGGILLPKEGLLAKIENGAYDADTNILYITGAELEEPPA